MLTNSILSAVVGEYNLGSKVLWDKYPWVSLSYKQ